MSENREVLKDIIAERTTRRITAQLTDEGLSPLAKANVQALTMTLYAPNASGEPIINSNSAVNILDANQGSVSADGLITLTLNPADNQILDDTLDLELHRLLVVWTFDSGTKTGRQEIDFYVRNLTKVS